MSARSKRYPGAQPFTDSDTSRRTFFGRAASADALANQILANRLIVVYAKSGIGKTSLLNAAVAPRLRAAQMVPLLVRLGDVRLGPLGSLYAGIAAEAQRQEVEYVAGQTGSLWQFFKTTQFWRGDLLLTPVLICDQFEELFTLHDFEAREAFLEELGYIVRGVPRPLAAESSSDGPGAPRINIVLSLREDFLGLLEEAADLIPQILDHRFRVMPLSYEEAQDAILCPAALSDHAFDTRPFALERDLLDKILDRLSATRRDSTRSGRRYVEPFQLQLICQHLERVASVTQASVNSEITLSLADVGGEPALAQTLSAFYHESIRTIREKRFRLAARRLCEEYLINPEGRRVSVEEYELRRQLRIPKSVLQGLVDIRLLRTDRRSDQTYYELSHDTLVAPILARHRNVAITISWVQTSGGTMFLLVGGLIAIFCMVLVINGVISVTVLGHSEMIWATFLGLLIMPIGLAAVAPGVYMLRSGSRRRRRYSGGSGSGLDDTIPALITVRERLWGVSELISGLLLVVVALSYVFWHAFNAYAAMNHLVPDGGWVHAMRARPSSEVAWAIIAPSTIGLAGVFFFQDARKRLWPSRQVGVASEEPASVRRLLVATTGSVLMLCVAALCLNTAVRCALLRHGMHPPFALWALLPYEQAKACSSGYDAAMFAVTALAFSALSILARLLPSIIRSGRGLWRQAPKVAADP